MTVRGVSATTSILDWSNSPDILNEDEYFVRYSKGLSLLPNGLPLRTQYNAFWDAVESRDAAAVEAIRPVLHWADPFRRKGGWSRPVAPERLQRSVPWVDPIAGWKGQAGDVLAGLFAAPWFNSTAMLGDMAELYWAALCRDLPFSAYQADSLSVAATTELKRLDPLNFSTSLFRVSMPGVNEGGYLSQFLINPMPLGGNWLSQRINCPNPNSDFLTTLKTWRLSQKGLRTPVTTTYLPARRYIFCGRALAEYVRTDFTYQAFLCAALIMQKWGRVALSPVLPARRYFNSAAFVSKGWSDIHALIVEASRLALQDCWYWKWRVFRRLRPEEFAGRCVLKAGGFGDTSLMTEGLDALERSHRKFGTGLLTQSYPEGSPLHPSFPGGHAEIAGACVTILKAFSDPTFPIPAPVVPTDDGLDILGYRGNLTLEGELNKLAWNIGFGRTFAGIHYRSDHVYGILLGEALAIKLLEETGLRIFGEHLQLPLRRFDGSQTTINFR